MADLKYLSKFLKRIEPSSFLLMVDKCIGEQWPRPDPASGKTAGRQALLEQAQALSPDEQNALESLSESLLTLTDSLGLDAVTDASSRLNVDDGKMLRGCQNQFDRSLFLYLNFPKVFDTALERRELLELRSRKRTCKGFRAEKQGRPVQDADARSLLETEIAAFLKCPDDEVALTVYERDPNEFSVPSFYDVCCYYNRPPELRERVRNRIVESTRLVWAEVVYFRYYPESGSLQVMSQHPVVWQDLARVISEKLFKVAFTGEEESVLAFDVQQLGDEGFVLDLSGLPSLLKIKTTTLCWRNFRGKLTLESHIDDAKSVFELGRKLNRGPVQPARNNLYKAIVSVKIKPDTPKGSARTMAIDITQDRIIVHSLREKDRELAMLILRKNNLVRELDDEEVTSSDNDQVDALL